MCERSVIVEISNPNYWRHFYKTLLFNYRFMGMVFPFTFQQATDFANALFKHDNGRSPKYGSEVFYVVNNTRAAFRDYESWVPEPEPIEIDNDDDFMELMGPTINAILEEPKPVDHPKPSKRQRIDSIFRPSSFYTARNPGTHPI